MRPLRPIVATAMLALIAGCQGPQGPAGEQGPPGPEGDPGPITDPPVITEVAPAWGSSWSEITVEGAHFGATIDDTTVYVEGFEAYVLEATTNRVVIQPDVVVDRFTPTVITVETGNQMSNGMPFDLVPSGYPVDLGFTLPTAPSDAIEVGGDLYVASSMFGAPGGGLYVVGDDGWTSRVVPPERIAIDWMVFADPMVELWDAPVHLATDGEVVYFATVFGSIRQYDPATGAVTDVVAAVDPFDIEPMRIDGLALLGDDLFYTDAGDDRVMRLRLDAEGWEPSDHMPILTDSGIRNLATDGTVVYVADPLDDVIHVIVDPGGTTPTIVGAWGGYVHDPQALEVVGDQLVVGGSDGMLYSRDLYTAPAAEPLPFGVFASTDGYGYPIRGLYADAQDGLYLAQPESSVVRRIPDDLEQATTITAGLRVHFGITSLEGSWYLPSIGLGLFEMGPSPSAAWRDGALIEIRPDGASRVIHEGAFPADVVATDDDTLVVSDCFDRTLAAFDVKAGTRTVLYDDADGLRCPAGLYLAPDGDLFYTNAVTPMASPSRIAEPTGSIGRIAADGGHDPDFVTGLPMLAIELAGVGDTLLAAPLGVGEGMADVPIYAADGDLGGAAGVLVPAAAAGPVTALSASPLGTVHALRFGLGDVVTIDPDAGEVQAFGTTRVGWFGGAWGEGPFGMSASFALGYQPDGTLVVPDFAQGAVIGVAP